MKNKFYILSSFVVSLLFCSPSSSFSQCTVAIPSDAHVFDTSITVSSSGADIIGSNWICTGDTLVITSGFGSQTFFLEEGAFLFGGGGGSRTVYLKQGAMFDGGGGGSQMITYDDNSSYFNCGSVYPTYCHPLIFDYTNAPQPGCSFGTSVRDISLGEKIKIYPDPADDFVWIACEEKQNHNCLLSIYNSAGKEIFKKRVNQFPFEVKTTSMAEGIYFVTLLDDAGSLSDHTLIISR